jgi:uncharacterized membrane protein
MSAPAVIRHRSTQRLALVVAAGMAAAVAAVLAGVGLAATLVVGWGVGCLAYLVWVWRRIGGLDAAHTREHAGGEEPTRTTADLLLLLAALASIGAVVVVMLQARTHARDGLPTAALVLGSLLVTWTFIHTQYTLRYAGMYYAEPVGGIDFNDDADPRYSDFAYLAFDLGMTFQVSDTTLRSSEFRQVVLVHTLVSYLFSTLVLGATVNLIASLISG